jgi:aspartyl-tRNA(Asn)/glutamyl-tRNA(Gln) amidotransferase subunit A
LRRQGEVVGNPPDSDDYVSVTSGTQPWQLGVAEIVAEIAAGSLTPRELVDSLLERIESVEPLLRMWVTLDRDGARAEAERLGLGGSPSSAVRGVPVGVKDIFHVAGLPTTASSKSLTDLVPDRDATTVARLRAAGAVIMGKLETCEYAGGDPSVTRNPWNPRCTPGGSSSGSAVAVAAGAVPFALGSQTVGSTLRPAAYNGVVGYKPSYGLVSCHGVLPLAWSFDHVGLFARSVGDVVLVLSVLAGYDPLDPASVPGVSDGYRAPDDAPGPPVVAVVRAEDLRRPAEDEMRAATEDVLARLEAAGTEIREVSLPGVYDTVAELFPELLEAETAAYHEERYATRSALYGPRVAATVKRGLDRPAAGYVRGQRRRAELVRDLDQRLDALDVDVLLTPTAPGPAPDDLSATGDPTYLLPWSFAGLPAISVPIGLSSDGLPLGVQLVARRWQDARLLNAARWVEQVVGFAHHPPGW